MNSWILRSVRDVLADKGSQVWNISADATVCDALELMAEKKIGAVLVVEGSIPVGILSERDFARSAVHEQRTPKQIRVREIMSRDIVTVSPDKTVEDCMNLMTHRRMRHLPVMDGDRLVGLVSIGDVVKWIITEQVGVIDQLERYIAGPNVTA
jgi:CBS domain-containing protein